ncbi:MAG: NAD+ synthase [Methanothrix sp.]|jgi:NAD+ synthase/NAD+ synthase (glutamine-hydrolysing)|nr:NAD+ synthase [Methanothrix sp.]
MKIALLQLNPTVGDLRGNAALIADAARRAAGADLAVTSELALLGYPPRDLLLNAGFVERSWAVLRDLAQELSDLSPLLVGLAEPNPSEEGRPLFNSAALLRRGRVERTFRKTLLPTYDVFDEDRYFEPATESQILELQDAILGISICEDIWNDRDFWKRRRYHTDPVQELVAAGAQAIINLSASPFTSGKQKHREAMLADLAKKHRVPFFYANQVGGNDDLVFDGRSCVFDGNGRLVARAQGFEADLIVADLNMTGLATGKAAIAKDDFAIESEIWRALVLGTRDYVHKCGFSGVLLGLSGGIDSSLVAAIAAQALGPSNVLGVLMPSPYTSQASIDDATALAQNLGIKTIIMSITDIMKSYDQELAKPFQGQQKDVTEENIQARIRGNLLMALSNKFRLVLLTTGNKSELAVGYCTIYGDMSGGLAVISDVPKSTVYRLAEWLNARGREIIPTAVLHKAPTAELRFGQIDQDSLPPYEVLDDILARYIQMHQSKEDLLAEGFEKAMVERVLSLVKGAEFKRRQAAPGLKVTDRAFGSGWRMPVASRAW